MDDVLGCAGKVAMAAAGVVAAGALLYAGAMAAEKVAEKIDDLRDIDVDWIDGLAEVADADIDFDL